MDTLNNLPPFYIGQKVVYITGIEMPKNSIHTISDIQIEECGCYAIEINGAKIKSEILEGEYLGFRCVHCGKVNQSKIDLKGWLSTSFRAIKEQTFPLLTYRRVIEKELVSAN